MSLKGYLTDNVKISRVMNGVVAGTTDQNSTAVDMAGFDGVVFVAAFGALTATQVTKIKAQQGTDSSMTDAADLEGTLTTGLADTDGNKLLVLDIQDPRERYVRCVVDRGTANAVIDGVIAIQYKSRGMAVTQSSTIAYSEQHYRPAEGTA